MFRLRERAGGPMIRTMKIALPVLVLAGGFAAAAALVATREETAGRPAEERAWPIETVAVRLSDMRPTLRLHGEVVAGREVELRAPVAGAVVWAAPEFAEGGAVAAGAKLIEIDPFDHRQAVVERTAARDEALARIAEIRARLAGERALLEEDAAQVAIAERDLARRESLVGAAVSEKGLDDARLALSQARARRIQRRQAIGAAEAQAAQQEAAAVRLGAALARAERALEDTVVRAPFGGWLARVGARAGARVGAGDRLARLIDDARMEARFHLPEAAFGRLVDDGVARPATVVWRLGARTLAFDAEIDRIDGEVDPAAGGVAARARILDDGGAAFDALRPGAFVEVLAPDRLYRRVARLPATALHGAGTVYAVVDDRLEPREVRVVGRDGGHVLATGALADGDAVAATRLSEMGPGLKVCAAPCR